MCPPIVLAYIDEGPSIYSYLNVGDWQCVHCRLLRVYEILCDSTNVIEIVDHNIWIERKVNPENS